MTNLDIHPKQQDHVPKVGDLYVFRPTSDWDLQWLTLATDSDGLVEVVAVDEHSLVGSADVAFEESESGSQLVARCSASAFVPAAYFEAALRTGSVSSASVLDQARQKSLGKEHAEGASWEENDSSPEYLDEILTPVRAAIDALKRLEETSQQPAKESRLARGPESEEAGVREAVRVGDTIAAPRRSMGSVPEPRTWREGAWLRAASLILFGAALGYLAPLLAHRWSQGPAASATQVAANVPVFLLIEPEAERADGAELGPVPLPPEARSFAVALSSIDRHLYEEYRVEIRPLNHREAVSAVVEGLRPDHQGLLTLEVTTEDAALRSGCYFRLLGVSDQIPNGQRFLAAYTLALEP